MKAKSRRDRASEYAETRHRAFMAPGYHWLGSTGAGPCAVCGHRDVLSVHHVRGRRGALLCDVRYWLLVCPVCHAYIHNNPDKARLKGWLAKKGDWGRTT